MKSSSVICVFKVAKTWRHVRNSALSVALIISSLVVVLAGTNGPVRAADGTLIRTFDAQVQEGTILKALVLPDGKIVLGGRYLKIQGQSAPAYARLQANGVLDPTFASDQPSKNEIGEVSAMAYQPDGKLLVGGYFGIRRVNTDGTLDSTFRTTIEMPDNLGSDDYSIREIAVLPDGKVLLAGRFSKVNGTSRQGLARVDSSGNLDQGFQPGTGVGNVLALKTLDNGQILIGQLNLGATLARLSDGLMLLNADGSVDRSFYAGIDLSVQAIEVQPDGKIVIAGDFTQVGGDWCQVGSGANYTYCGIRTSRVYLARLLSNGTVDVSFTPSVLEAPPGQYGVRKSLRSLALQSDGKILATGDCAYFPNLVYGRCVFRVSADGSLDQGFATRLGEPGVGVLLNPSGGVLVYGSFDNITETPTVWIRNLALFEGSSPPYPSSTTTTSTSTTTTTTTSTSTTTTSTTTSTTTPISSTSSVVSVTTTSSTTTSSSTTSSSTTPTTSAGYSPSADQSDSGACLLVARLSVSEKVYVGDEVGVSGLRSVSTCGDVRSFEWDLNGDGKYEIFQRPGEIGAGKSLMRVSSSGQLSLGLRIIDERGNTDSARALITAVLRPPPGVVGVTINNGDRFSRTKNVTVALVWPDGARDVRISTNSRFDKRSTFEPALSPNLEIPLKVSRKDDRILRVYVRFEGDGIDSSRTYSDFIRFDPEPPVIEKIAARQTGSDFVLAVKARDFDSKVDLVEYRSRLLLGRRKFSEKIAIRIPKSFNSLNVLSGFRFRIRDGAGNWTDWYLVA